jgi:TIR domain-containing protein
VGRVCGAGVLAITLEQNMYVFISHSSLDKPYVRQLADSLAYYGVPLFLDEREIKIGDNIPDKIYSALEKATHIVYVLSKNSINSSWVKEEFSIAKKRQIDQKGCLILPVLLDSVEPPASIAHIKYADFRNWQVKEPYFEAVRGLVNALGIKAEFSSSAELHMFQLHLSTLVTIKAMADVVSELYFQLERLFFVPPYDSPSDLSYWYAESVRKTWSIDAWRRAYKILEDEISRLGSSSERVGQVVKLCKVIENDYSYFLEQIASKNPSDKRSYHSRIDLAKDNADKVSAKVYEVIMEINSLE